MPCWTAWWVGGSPWPATFQWLGFQPLTADERQRGPEEGWFGGLFPWPQQPQDPTKCHTQAYREENQSEAITIDGEFLRRERAERGAGTFGHFIHQIRITLYNSYYFTLYIKIFS